MGVARDHPHDREVVRQRERMIALVVAGHGHDRTRAVLHEHVVGDPHRNGLARGGIHRVRAGEDAALLLRRLAAHEILLRGLFHVLPHVLALVVARDRLHERMLGGQHEVGRAKDRVGARGEHAHLGGGHRDLAREPRGRRRATRKLHHVLHHERDLRALGPADPVALRGLRALGPVQPIQVREEPPRVVRDAEEPLLQEALLDDGAAPLARAAHDLFVGEHRLVERTPVDGGGLLVGEPLLVQLEEDPLRPLVVRRVRRGQLVAPVHHQPRALHLPAEVVDIPGNELARMHADLDRVILGVNAECVKAEGLEYGVPLKPLESSMDVISREREEVAHMQPLRARIREHHQRVERVRPIRQVGRVRTFRLPARLPLLLDGGRIVSGGRVAAGMWCCEVFHGSRVSRLGAGPGAVRRGRLRLDVGLCVQFSTV